MEWLELFNVVEISSRHSLRAHDKLWKERHIEANENKCRRNSGPDFTVHLSEHFRPPIVNTSEEGHHHTTNHHIVEVCYHVVGVVKVNIHGKSLKHDSCKSSDSK